MQLQQVRWWMAVLLGGMLLGFGRMTGAQPAAPQDVPPTTVTQENGYRITFLGVVYAPSGASIWRYQVDELASAQDLSNWVLELPGCVRIVTAEPEPWEAVNPDPNAQLSGIKWQTGAGFQQGQFTVTLAEPWGIGTTQVAAKGPDVARGVIAGPICVRVAALALAKTVDRTTALPGDVLTYTITLSNPGAAAVANLSLTDPIPAGAAYVEDSLRVTSGAGRYDVATNQVRWDGGLAADQTLTLTFNVRVQKGISAGSTITNTVRLGDQGATATTRIGPAGAPALYQVYLPLMRR